MQRPNTKAKQSTNKKQSINQEWHQQIETKTEEQKPEIYHRDRQTKNAMSSLTKYTIAD